MKVFNKVYVYDCDAFKDREVFENFYNKMDEKRKEKIDRMKNDSDKYLSLGAGVLLKTVLSDLGIKEFELEIRANGKPYIKGREDVFFNLSHSGRYAVMTISDREVGIDIEKNKNFKESLVKRIFDEQEVAMASETLQGAETFSATCTRSADAYYTGLWTAKESVMKYFGIGIGMDPAKIHLETKDQNEEGDCSCLMHLSATSEKEDCSSLTIHRYELEDYQISVCSEYDVYGRVVPVG